LDSQAEDFTDCSPQNSVQEPVQSEAVSHTSPVCRQSPPMESKPKARRTRT